MYEHGSVNSLSAPAEQVTVSDLCASREIRLDIPSDVDDDTALMSGRFLKRKLGNGLTLHGGDFIEERAFDVHSSIEEGLSCIFFLNGTVDTCIGDRRFGFQALDSQPIHAVTMMNARAETFSRRTLSRQKVTHLVIDASREWLEIHGHDTARDKGATQTLFAENLIDHRWLVPQQLLELVRAVMAASIDKTPLQRLYTEALTIQIVAESICCATKREASITEGLNGSSKRRAAALRRAKEFIAVEACNDISVARIAKEAAISVSGLQSLFRQDEGCGVFEYVRRIRLERARDGLMRGEFGISEAAMIAGYSHPANFTTAFRKHFAVTPSLLVGK
ncbi:AraC family transcriptional regulator [Paracoccus onubensis]|uniref:AraC family transcriptional regulator n=1 Tax=Paracoccus onubensis TaxID=1675788 RepID=A0A418STG4_9RHOB|nr:AraC family transcriptional regulator [Paracoccus onubensis]